MKNFDIMDYGVVCDVKEDFFALREEYSKNDAIKKILISFNEELNDIDDKPYVYIGLAKALLELGEKIPRKIKEEILKQVSSSEFQKRFIESSSIKQSFVMWLENFKYQVVNDVNLKKIEGSYRKIDFKKWRVGDLYCFSGLLSNTNKYVAIYFYVKDFVKLDTRIFPVVFPYIKKDLQFIDVDEINSLIPLAFRVIKHNNSIEQLIYRHILVDNKIATDNYNFKYIGSFTSLPMPFNEWIGDVCMYRWMSIENIPQIILQDIEVMKTNNILCNIST